MTRNLAIAAATFVALSTVTVTVREAGAFGTAVRLCVQKARQNRSAALNQCKGTALQTYETQFITCFAPGNGQDCASKCQSTLDSCLLNPAANRKTANTACATQFKTDVTACNTDPDPVKCLATARLNNFNCLQAAAAAVQPDIDTCNQNFTDCAEFCG
jgi:hypothetical protein